MTLDKFGISKIYETLVGGREWYSKWDNGIQRSFSDTINDPYDTEFVTMYKGIGSYYTDGLGILKISGITPRMYVMDSAQTKNWNNIEITVYGMRVSDTNIAYSGISVGARTNHFIDTNLCDTRGLHARIRNDGNIDFGKETSHPTFVAVGNTPLFTGGFPFNTWIGYKFIVYDLPDGTIKMELYYDTSDGSSGGNWIKAGEFIDNGTNLGTIAQGGISCATGIDPALELTNSDIRPGSETGNPNLAVYFRADGINNNGLLYKKASIRTISLCKFNLASNLTV